MPDVSVAIPIGVPQPAVPVGMALNPYMDWSPLLGIPLWLIVSFAFVLLNIVVLLYWIFRIKKLQGVKGYVETAKNQTQDEIQVWVLSKTQKLTIECLRIIDTVIQFRDKQIITRWRHTSPFSTIRIGGVPGVIVSHDYDQTRDIISEIALTYACEQFNFNQESLKEEMKKKEELKRMAGEPSDKPNVVKPISNYMDYKNYGCKCLQVIHPDGLEIPVYNVYNPVQFRKYFPKGRSATQFGGIYLRSSRNLNVVRKEKSLWEKLIPFGIILAIVALSIMGAWLFPLKG